MKYIIELPEEVKEKFNKTDNINFCFYDYNSFIGKAIRNGTPFSEELEKIMKELKELAFDFDDLSPDKELVVDLDNIEEVIDKHINELKGENNG